MKYLLLPYVDPALEPAPGSPEFDTYIQGFFEAFRRMTADGVFLGGEGAARGGNRHQPTHPQGPDRDDGRPLRRNARASGWVLT